MKTKRKKRPAKVVQLGQFRFRLVRDGSQVAITQQDEHDKRIWNWQATI